MSAFTYGDVFGACSESKGLMLGPGAEHIESELFEDSLYIHSPSGNKDICLYVDSNGAACPAK
jgi:hypothetical protein